MSNENLLVGSWEILPMKPIDLPQKLATAFSEAVGGIIGASYTPVLYPAKQLVSGENHMILCLQELVTNPPIKHLVKMILYVDLSGKGSIRSIEAIV